ncbi:MAG: MerR family transcriptional regulator [Gammaproteobacteria bacterium CG11_big_fil_rev_8_21_14_0_20_46_22]|nr:MAG: MerR family transcriptional regulator [Gammaproteobacteria bacterium CG12_big_fil_rev_8_21_14_0_65_46_12]PIR11179.1 MAG: MerR family transcriptional regulator [Gammaproteobacteria bacterium CG11_big_fil_rev_8_21_14_0_20_46_22]
MQSNLYDKMLLSKLLVGIGEVSTVTGIPQRQIRYWEEKGIVASVPSEKDASTRRYDYPTIKRMILIKELLDEGYTLKAAVEKVNARYERLDVAFKRLK